MTFYHVDVTHYVHTCPADAEPHVWQTVRKVVDRVSGGPCRKPVTLFVGDTMNVIACGSYRPDNLQCPACRNVIIERTITTITGADQ